MFVSMAITYSLLSATFVRAIPAHGHTDHTGGDNGCNVTKPSGGSCNLSYTRMNLPAAAQAALGVESGPPQYVAYGKGTQNYTCSAGKWTSDGAIANLYDLSCAPKELLSHNDDTDYAQLEAYTKNASIIFHDAVNTDSGVDPRFTKEPHATSGTYSTMSISASFDDPTNSTKNVAWVKLTKVDGNFVQTIYRAFVQGGQPPSSCDNSTDPPVLTVPYTTIYWAFGDATQ